LKIGFLSQLSKETPEIRSLSDLKKYIEDIPTLIVDFNKKIDHIFEMYEVLDNN